MTDLTDRQLDEILAGRPVEADDPVAGQLLRLRAELRDALMAPISPALASAHITAMRAVAGEGAEVRPLRPRRPAWAAAAAVAVLMAAGAVAGPLSGGVDLASHLGEDLPATAGHAAAAENEEARFGLCTAWADGEGGEGGAKNDAPPFAGLQAAAGEESVEDFCAPYLEGQGEIEALNEHPDAASHGQEISSIARDSGTNGKDKGQEVSEAASKKSVDHRKDGENVPEQTGSGASSKGSKPSSTPGGGPPGS